MCDTSTTICWHCKHAVPTFKDDRSREYATGCEWSINKRPVAGWIAEKTTLKLGEGRCISSYLVKYCPKFEKG